MGGHALATKSPARGTVPTDAIVGAWAPSKDLRRVELDPEHRLIDVNRDNNAWSPLAVGKS